MNVLFLCLSKVWDLEERGIYSDLLRTFTEHGDQVYVVTPVERRFGEKTQMIDQGSAKFLKVKTLNIQKTNVLEKGLGTVLLEGQYLRAIRKYYSDVKFDLVLYTTPPITLVKPIRYIKKRDHARTYLLLKDIFPQNAVDIGMMRTTGVKGILYRFFRRKEKKLYQLSDRIGCMSQANADYVLAHNPEIASERVEVCPNSIIYEDMSVTAEQRLAVREKYGLPQDKKIFIYGGNLGRPQGIPFIMECLKAEKDNENVFFVIVGDGTEFHKLETYFTAEQPKNAVLFKRLPKEDYDTMVGACDVGLIFLDHRFTIPNFPSRLLGYMQAKLPVLACTDTSTDIGKVVTEGGFGWWCESSDVQAFCHTVETALTDMQSHDYRKCIQDYMLAHYTTERAYSIIMKAE